MQDIPGTQYFNLSFETDWPETGNTSARFIHLFRYFSLFYLLQIQMNATNRWIYLQILSSLFYVVQVI